MSTQLVLDALEQAVWTRQRTGSDLSFVVAHTDRGKQYTSIRYTERLAQVGIAASVDTTGDSYDNALAETINSLYKTELIQTPRALAHRRPRRDRYRRMGRLVQLQEALRILRRHPTRRTRDRLLRSKPSPAHR